MSKELRTRSAPKTIYDRVAAIIRETPEAAYNQNLLLVLYWLKNDGVTLSSRQIAQIAEASKAESIARIYRFVREDNIEQVREGVLTWMKEKL